METAYSFIVCALMLAGVGWGIVDPVTTMGYIERGVTLRPLLPSVSFGTLILFTNQKKSKIVIEMTNALTKVAGHAGQVTTAWFCGAGDEPGLCAEDCHTIR